VANILRPFQMGTAQKTSIVFLDWLLKWLCVCVCVRVVLIPFILILILLLHEFILENFPEGVVSPPLTVTAIRQMYHLKSGVATKIVNILGTSTEGFLANVMFQALPSLHFIN